MNIQQQLEHKIQSQRKELFDQQRVINQYKERDRLADLIVYCTAACRPKEGPQNITEQVLKEYGQILRRLETYYFNFEWRKDKNAGLTFKEQCRVKINITTLLAHFGLHQVDIQNLDIGGEVN